MKGKVKTSPLGPFTFDTRPEGIVIFESIKNGFYEGRPFKFKARVDGDDTSARIIHLSAHPLEKRLREEISTTLPQIWQAHCRAHPPIRFLTKLSIERKDRDKLKSQIKEVADKIQVQLTYLNNLIDAL